MDSSHETSCLSQELVKLKHCKPDSMHWKLNLVMVSDENPEERSSDKVLYMEEGCGNIVILGFIKTLNEISVRTLAYKTHGLSLCVQNMRNK